MAAAKWGFLLVFFTYQCSEINSLRMSNEFGSSLSPLSSRDMDQNEYAPYHPSKKCCSCRSDRSICGIHEPKKRVVGISQALQVRGGGRFSLKPRWLKSTFRMMSAFFHSLVDPTYMMTHNIGNQKQEKGKKRDNIEGTDDIVHTFTFSPYAYIYIYILMQLSCLENNKQRMILSP